MQKCIGKTLTGKQCTRSATDKGCCWQHKQFALPIIDIKECSNEGKLDLVKFNTFVSDMKRITNSGMYDSAQFNYFIASGNNDVEEYIDYAPIRVPMLSRPKEAYVNVYNLTYFPFLSITNDAQYELIYQMNVRNTCKLFRTCKLLYQFWRSKHESSAENNQMWFNLCILNGLISHSINLPKKFVDWKACCITRYRKGVECANCRYEHSGELVHSRGTCSQFIKAVFINYK